MTGDSVTGYPGEPWSLRGQMHLSVFAVPGAALPTELPPGTEPLILRGRGVVAVAWVVYEPGSVLRYREVLSTVLVRHRRLLLPTVSHIWVDSEASRDGGRELWGIPKRLAEFEIRDDRFTARLASGAIASASVRRLPRLPGRLPFRFRVVQELNGTAKFTPVRGSTRVQRSRIRWWFDPDGPLEFLAGRTPAVSVSLTDLRMRFGGPGRVSSG